MSHANTDETHHAVIIPGDCVPVSQCNSVTTCTRDDTPISLPYPLSLPDLSPLCLCPRSELCLEFRRRLRLSPLVLLSLSLFFFFFFSFFFLSACSFLSRQSGKPGQSTKLVRSAHLYPVMCVTPRGWCRYVITDSAMLPKPFKGL